MLRIDAHQHFWKYNSQEYDWLEGDLSVLRRDFLPKDLLQEISGTGVQGAVTVQARQSVAEMDWLLTLADETPALLGVVGWLPLCDASFPAHLERYRARPALKGLRHVVQGEHSGFMDQPAFNAAIAQLAGSSLVYDLLIYPYQLGEAVRLVDRHPGQSFVLDHLAKPRIVAGEMEPWSTQVRELAKRPNVVCKVSGMVTEADLHYWSTAQLRPYFDTVLDAFTPHRLMAGSDWPVLLAGCSYRQWWALLDRWVAALSEREQAAVLGETASRIYGLETGHLSAPTIVGVEG